MAFAFCAESLQESAGMTAGVSPLTSPPTVLSTFDPHVLEGHALLFFKLHGALGSSFWYGDGGVPACSAQQLASARLNGVLVFAANCWGGPQAPMVQALMSAGAAAVVTGEGLNYAGTTMIDGCDIIGIVWRALLEIGADASRALLVAKAAALLHRPGLLADIESFTLVGSAGAKLLKETGKHAS